MGIVFQLSNKHLKSQVLFSGTGGYFILSALIIFKYIQ
jgi:hypothetical protein